MTTFLGFGAATILTPDRIIVDGKPNDNMARRCSRRRWVAKIFFAFISAVAFATILAVVAGLTISASTSFAHDFYTNVIHHGKEQSARRRGARGPDHRVRRRRGLQFSSRSNCRRSMSRFSSAWRLPSPRAPTCP